MLFIKHHQSQIVNVRVCLDQRVSADEKRCLRRCASLEKGTFSHRFDFLIFPDELFRASQEYNPVICNNWQFGESLEMLACQYLCRHH